MNGLSRNNSSASLHTAGGAVTRAGTPQPQRSRGNPLMRLGAACDSSMSVASAPPKPKGDWDELFAGCKSKDLERPKPTGVVAASGDKHQEQEQQQQQQPHVAARGRAGSNVTL